MEEQSIVLTIQDNGSGFSTEDDLSKKGIGITGLTERMTLVGGRLKISSSALKGTIISARLPLTESYRLKEEM